MLQWRYDLYQSLVKECVWCILEIMYCYKTKSMKKKEKNICCMKVTFPQSGNRKQFEAKAGSFRCCRLSKWSVPFCPLSLTDPSRGKLIRSHNSPSLTGPCSQHTHHHENRGTKSFYRSFIYSYERLSILYKKSSSWILMILMDCFWKVFQNNNLVDRNIGEPYCKQTLHVITVAPSKILIYAKPHLTSPYLLYPPWSIEIVLDLGCTKIR